MDDVVDYLDAAYGDFIAAATATLEAKKASNGENTTATITALENLKQNYELFRVSCDRDDDFVESAKQRIGSEYLVDEATDSMVGEPGQPELPPINAVRLEQMSKAVRLLVMAGSGGGGMVRETVEVLVRQTIGGQVRRTGRGGVGLMQGLMRIMVSR